MEDKKLLELAAKAAGIKLAFDKLAFSDTELTYMPFDSNRGVYWNPLTDDGDALRLAVKLRIDIDFYGDHIKAYNYQTSLVTEFFCKDENYATRRAIVRAAAEIGKDGAE